MITQEVLDRLEYARQLIREKGLNEDYIGAIFNYAKFIDENDGEKEYATEVYKELKGYIESVIENATGGTFWDLEKYCFKNGTSYNILDLYYKVLLQEARNRNLDSYLLYLERKREPKDRFYIPKRKHLMKIGLIQALQDMLDDKLDILTLSMPPGVGKTTMSKFFISGVMGWFPDDYNLFYSHSSDITRMYYDGVLDIITNSDEYTWGDIFADVTLESTNAKREIINLNKFKPFQNLQCTSVGAKNSGKVRCNRFLMCDDLIGGIEEALNKNTLDKLWDIYAVDARQRKVRGAKEIHIATRWSVHDPIGRLQNIYSGNERCRFIAFPDIDPQTGKSNFDYEFGGFDEQFFHDQELVMDDISYRCLYKNEPIEREGLLYHENELRRYFQVPEVEQDAVLSICDTKSSGTDYMFLPVFAQYGNDYYCLDCICDNSSDFDIQQHRICDIIINNRIQQCEFESNAGGNRLAYDVDKMLREEYGYTGCNITTKPTESNKETKIIVNSDWIKKHCLFKERELYDKKSDYGKMMDFMLGYSVAGKNKNDDVPDGLAMFRLFVDNLYTPRRTRIIRSPF